MTIEVEMKFAVSDEAELRQRLTKWGVDLGQSERQLDSYFSHPTRDFSNTDEALRIRRTESRVEVTYKGPRLDERTKTRQEIEVSLAGGEIAAPQFEQILQALGFGVAGEVTKSRRVGQLQVRGRMVTVALDQVDGLGSFLELESIVCSADVVEARANLEHLARELDLGVTERRSYLELVGLHSSQR
ncbi:MAG: class IV adenylate cyclase [Planctomycetota bacterium]|nr:class IV adenylate cyclase [Planctomycetota bacterium]